MNQSDEIKSKLDIVDVIREYIPLKPAGVNFRANCPFHHEKTPSFVVSPEKQIWHCFGCSKGGDIFSFVMEMDGISFVDSLRNLAPKAGITLKKQDPKLTSQRNRLLDIVTISKKYYQNVLLKSPKAEEVRKYLKERGVTDETIEEWEIGYSPESWDDLINFLKEKGYTENEIFLAGMSVKKEGVRRAATNGAHTNESNNVSRFYNRFRGRIMFPINDVNANTMAFSARINPGKEADEKMGKYINSPQTMIYDKSKILFGLDKAKQEIKKQDLSIITEGQMDVITAHQNNYKNVVASSGTALAEEQIKLLKRYSENIALAFDMDKAGEMAADRGIKEAMQEEMNTKVIILPEGKDPDEFIKKNPEEFMQAVKSAKPIMEYYFEKIFNNLDLSLVENKREAARKLLPIIAKLGNNIEKDFWLRKLSQKIDVKESILLETINKVTTKMPYKRDEAIEPSRESKTLPRREEMLSELLLALILKFPSLIEYTSNHIESQHIVGKENISIYKNLIIYYNNIIDNWTQEGGKTEAPQVSYEGFKSWLINTEEHGESHGEIKVEFQNKEDQLNILDKLVLLGDKDFYEYDKDQAKNETIKIIVNLKKYYLLKRKKEIEKLIPEAEKENNEDAIKSLMEEFKILTDELSEM